MFVLLVAGTMWMSLSAGAAPAHPSVDVVKVEGIVDPSEASYVRSTILEAERTGATVILQVDSLGQYGDRAANLGPFIRSASVPVIAWVGSSGARAEGGALYLVFGSSMVTMAPGAGIGPGPPFDLSTRASSESAAVRQANLDALVSLASGAGLSAAAVRAAVAAPLPAAPAQEAGVAAIVAPDIPTLLGDLDGKTVRVGTATVTLATRSTPDRPVDVRFHEIGLFRRVLHAVSTPVAVYVMLVLGIWAVAFEFTQPGIGMAGIAGVLLLALAGYGLWVIPVYWLGIALLVVGIALWGVDVIVRRLAWFTAFGTALFVAGSLVAWWGVAPAIRVPVGLVALFTVSGFLLFGFGFTVALQARERIRSQQVGLVGLTGEARSDIDPEGGVIVKGAVWRARSADGKIPKGTKVRVRGIDGLVLRVEPEPEPDG